MRVMVLHLGRTGAGPSIAIEQARALSAAGAEVTVCYSSDAEQADVLSSCADRAISVRTYKSMLDVLFGLPRAFKVARQVRELARKGKVDAVVASMGHPWQILIALGARLGGAPYLASVHDVGRHLGEKSAIASVVQFAEVCAASGVLFYSRYSFTVARESWFYRAQKCFLTTHGPLAETAPARKKLSADKDITVGFLGRIEEYKGLPLALEAVKLLRLRGARVRLEIWGSGDESQVSDIQQLDFVDLHFGWIAEEELTRIVDRFDVIVLPYREASQSGVLMLAAPRGVPAVVSPVGALPEVVQASGAGVVADGVTPLGLANAIESVVSDSCLYESMSAAGIEAVSVGGSLGWAKGAEQIVGAFSACSRRR